jgi:hypothetical protein
MSAAIPTKYGKRSKMHEWLVNFIRGQQGRDADAACAETLLHIREHRQKIERRREERESSQYAHSGRSLDIDLTK